MLERILNIRLQWPNYWGRGRGAPADLVIFTDYLLTIFIFCGVFNKNSLMRYISAKIVTADSFRLEVCWTALCFKDYIRFFFAFCSTDLDKNHSQMKVVIFEVYLRAKAEKLKDSLLPLFNQGSLISEMD